MSILFRLASTAFQTSLMLIKVAHKCCYACPLHYRVLKKNYLQASASMLHAMVATDLVSRTSSTSKSWSLYKELHIFVFMTLGGRKSQ
uniref:Putative secreted protein n=1 Tax=Ixodes ricinus TaxID=34613 RepID=A0A147BUY3_IXORI